MFAVLHIADFALHAVLRAAPAPNITGDVAGVADPGSRAQRAPLHQTATKRESGDSSTATNRAAAATNGSAPAALFEANTKKSLVLATNAGARRAGVELGMTAPQAVARCPTLIIRAPDADAEREATAAFLALALTLSPAVEHTGPGICTIDLKGLDVAHHRKHAQIAVSELHALGLPATAGIGRTPLLALYAARTAGRLSGSRRHECDAAPTNGGQTALPLETVAESSHAEDTASRSGLRPAPEEILLNESPAMYGSPLTGQVEDGTYVAADATVLLVADEKNFLAPLPLAAADPSPELASVFENWGLRTLGDLTAVSRDEIVRRFGAEGLALWQRAAGGGPRPLHLIAPPREFAAGVEFEHEIETLEPLLFVLRRFIERLALELRATQHVAAEIALTLQLADETAHTHEFRLPEPTADVEILFRALHTHLESLHTVASIVAVQLRVTPARPLVRQQGLFETGLRDPHGFAETLARLAALVGAERVGTPQRDDTHRPDAVKLAPPPAVVAPPSAPPSPGSARGPEPVEGLHPRLGPPLRRFRPPLPARVEFTDSRASYLWTDRVQGEIVQQSHAWPTSGEWWQSDRAWDRREWDVALAGGGLFRLIETNDGYFVEGEYD